MVPFHIFVQKLALSYSDFEISKFNGMRTIIAWIMFVRECEVVGNDDELKFFWFLMIFDDRLKFLQLGSGVGTYFFSWLSAVWNGWCRAAFAPESSKKSRILIKYGFLINQYQLFHLFICHISFKMESHVRKHENWNHYTKERVLHKYVKRDPWKK